MIQNNLSKAKCWKIEKSEIHGKGIFATRTIREGQFIIAYEGEKVTKEQSRRRCRRWLSGTNAQARRATYLFELNKRFDVDGSFSYNKARFLNHSCEPNAFAKVRKREISFFALRDIDYGEEITINYNYGLGNFWDYPCNCGAPRCVGFTVDEALWPELDRRIDQIRKAIDARRPSGPIESNQVKSS